MDKINNLLNKLDAPDNIKEEVKVSNSYEFDMDTMFEEQTWSTTLQEHRDEGKGNEEIVPNENIEESIKEGKKSFRLGDKTNEEKKDENNEGITPFNGGSNIDEPEAELSAEEIQTQKDFANLTVLLFDMGVNFTVELTTKFEVKEKESDNTLRRKQLERSCIKIMNHYDFVPNMWTELLTVLSAYGMQKFNSLEKKEDKKKKRGRRTKKVTPESHNEKMNQGIDRINKDPKEQVPAPEKTETKEAKKLPLDNIGVVAMMTSQNQN